MELEKIRNYAHTVAAIGANVEKGDEVWVYASVNQIDFTHMIVEECYKLGAKSVEVNYSDQRNDVLASKYQKLSVLGANKSYNIAKLKYFSKKLPTKIYILSDDPDGMKKANQKKIAKAKMKAYPRQKPYLDAADNNYKWVICAAPCLSWAKKVFPHLSDDDAMEALWDAILMTSRCDGDGVKAWEEHHKFLKQQSKKLNDLNLVELKYKAPNGTDFRVGLIEGAKFIGGQETLPNGHVYSPNIPSEEIFTSPRAGDCDGLLVATKPLSYHGKLIEDFTIRFENGKVVEVTAKKGLAELQDMVNMDEGAKMLGEVALVPDDSPISNSNLLFYETLFDENAACHCALGVGFNVFEKDLSHDELTKLGVNDSMIHVDFMIGCKELDIVGKTKDGREVQIFKQGNWAI